MFIKWFEILNSFKSIDLQACNFIKKETLAQVFSCEFFEISKSTFLYRTPLVAASVISKFSEMLIFLRKLFLKIMSHENHWKWHRRKP